MATLLASVYVKLCEAGDTRMLQYRKDIPCNLEEAKVMGMEQYFATIKSEIQRLSEQLQEWKQKLEGYRKDHPVMNYFSVKQCLVLQKQLHELQKDIGKVTELDPQVFTLLKAVCPDITTEEIKDAFTLSFGLVSETANDSWQKVQSERPTNFNQFSLAQIEKILDTLNDQDIDDSVALASLVRLFPYDESQAIIWCKRQDPSNPLIDEMAEEAEEELEKLRLENERFVKENFLPFKYVDCLNYPPRSALYGF